MAASALFIALAATACASVSVVPRAPAVGGGGLPHYANPDSSSETWSGIHAFQVFDWGISQSQATAHAYRYDMVWGTSKPDAWKAGNTKMTTSWYAPFDGDFTTNHDLAWWKSNHPDWVLYKCDRHTPAGLGGLRNVPLDISNPAVVRWQMQTYAPGIEAGGYDALAEDLVGLNNANGGCGVFIGGQWVQRFTGQRYDDKWSQATLAWHEYAYSYLHGLSRPILIGVNHVPENRPFGDPEEQTLLNNVDFVDDESSFTDYGNGYASSTKFLLIVQWMKYAQNLGKRYDIDDKWNTRGIGRAQFDWAVATYLMGKYHHSSVYIDHLPGYGYEYWYSQYSAAVGSPCGDMYEDKFHTDLYFRKYTGALVVVNASSLSGYLIKLPNPTYKTIDGLTITSPVSLPPDGALVLLVQNGCA